MDIKNFQVQVGRWHEANFPQDPDGAVMVVAEEFSKVFPACDEDTVATWFANAMGTAEMLSDLPKWQNAARLSDQYAGLENQDLNGIPGVPSYQGLIFWRPGWSLFDIAHPPGEQYEEDLRVWRQEQAIRQTGQDIATAVQETIDAVGPFDQDALVEHVKGLKTYG